MEKNNRTISLRFNLDRPEQRKAWEYLQTMDKDVFRSYSHAICIALLDYFDRYYKTQEDPYLETREREERFVQQIVDAVNEALKQALPLFLAGCMAGLSAMQPTPAPVMQVPTQENAPAESFEETVPEDIDWGFLGE